MKAIDLLRNAECEIFGRKYYVFNDSDLRDYVKSTLNEAVEALKEISKNE